MFIFDSLSTAVDLKRCESVRPKINKTKPIIQATEWKAWSTIPSAKYINKPKHVEKILGFEIQTDHSDQAKELHRVIVSKEDLLDVVSRNHRVKLKMLDNI